MRYTLYWQEVYALQGKKEIIMFNKYVTTLVLVLSVFSFGSHFLYAGGLSTTFVEIKLENLEPGKSYSIKGLKNKALVVCNTTKNITTDIEVEPEIPVSYNIKKGYQPIPSLSWVKVQKSYFKDVKPGEDAETDIIINIPKNKNLYGKKYQVYIYSHTAGKEAFRMGLMSRLLIHTAEK